MLIDYFNHFFFLALNKRSVLTFLFTFQKWTKMTWNKVPHDVSVSLNVFLLLSIYLLVAVSPKQIWTMEKQTTRADATQQEVCFY